MKTSIALVSLIALAVGSVALADTQGFQTSELTSFNIDPRHDYDGRVDGGTVAISAARHEITLTLYRHFHCPPGAVCAMVMPAPIIVRLPITSVSVNRCGLRVFRAGIDRRPVDGNLETLEVSDETLFRCARPMHELRKQPVRVIHEVIPARFGGDTTPYHSEFEGEAFQGAPEILADDLESTLQK